MEPFTSCKWTCSSQSGVPSILKCTAVSTGTVTILLMISSIPELQIWIVSTYMYYSNITYMIGGSLSGLVGFGFFRTVLFVDFPLLCSLCTMSSNSYHYFIQVH